MTTSRRNVARVCLWTVLTLALFAGTSMASEAAVNPTSDVVRLSARTGTLLHKIEVEDTAVATIEFATGALGILEATTSVYPGYPRRVEVTGGDRAEFFKQT